MATVGKAFVQVVPTTKGIKAGLKKSIGPDADAAGVDAGNSFSDKMKGIIAKAAIGTAVVAGIKKAVSEGAALEQSLGGVETLFKENADTVVKNAQKAYKTAGMSANEYMENVTSFSAGLIKSVGGDTSKAAKAADMAMIDMSDNANKMGTNIEDIQHAYQGFAKQNYTMLDNLKLGYGGTKAEMERLLEDAGKLTGQKYDIDNLNDVYNAIHVIQKDIGITGTTAKEAEKTVSGSFNSMKAAATDFLGQLAIGGDVTVPLKALMSSTYTFLVGNLLPMIGNILKALPTVVITAISAIGPQLVPAGQSIINAITQGIDTAIAQLPAIFGTITANLPGLLDTGVQMITSLANGYLQGAPQMMNKISTIVSMITNFLITNGPVIMRAGVQLIGNLVVGIVKNLPAVIAATVRLTMSILSGIFKYRGAMVKEGLALVKSLVKGLGGAAFGLVKKAGNAIVNTLVSAVRGAIKKIQSICKSIGNIWNSLVNIARSVAGKVTKHFSFSGLKGIVSGVFNGVKNAIMNPMNAMKNAVKGIVDAIKGFFHFSVPTPHIPLPHFGLSPAGWKIGDLVKGKIPSLSVSWYAEGGIMTGPTLFGGGEAGNEAIVPLDPFWKKLEKLQTQGQSVTYNIGDVTLDVSELQDVTTLEDFVDVLRRAKAFA